MKLGILLAGVIGFASGFAVAAIVHSNKKVVKPTAKEEAASAVVSTGAEREEVMTKEEVEHVIADQSFGSENVFVNQELGIEITDPSIVSKMCDHPRRNFDLYSLVKQDQYRTIDGLNKSVNGLLHSKILSNDDKNEICKSLSVINAAAFQINPNSPKGYYNKHFIPILDTMSSKILLIVLKHHKHDSNYIDTLDLTLATCNIRRLYGFMFTQITNILPYHLNLVSSDRGSSHWKDVSNELAGVIQGASRRSEEFRCTQ